MHRLAVPPVRRGVGLIMGMLLDAMFADPRRGHPVAGFGRAAGALERRLYADDRRAGAVFAGVAVASVTGLGWLVERAAAKGGPIRGVAVTALATWAVLGGTSLQREGLAMARLLDGADGSDGTDGSDGSDGTDRTDRTDGTDGSDGTDGRLDAARARLRNLCARDPSQLDADGLARATVESLAENVSDAVVAPLLWGAVAGVPGLLGYRAVNTLDAMVGYRSPRYRNFGWASARLDDVANLVPARVSGVLLAACAPAVGGSGRQALRVLLRDGGDHPSPNAGRPEAAAAGALGVTLGGSNTYRGAVETRGLLGAPAPPPRVADVRRAVRLITVASVAGLAVATGLAVAAGSAVGVTRTRQVGQR